MQEEQQKDNEIKQLQMMSAMRDQEFLSMRAVETNLVQQQQQMQMAMMQMAGQMQQLGQTAQREEAMLQQVMAKPSLQAPKPQQALAMPQQAHMPQMTMAIPQQAPMPQQAMAMQQQEPMPGSQFLQNSAL